MIARAMRRPSPPVGLRPFYSTSSSVSEQFDPCCGISFHSFSLSDYLQPRQVDPPSAAAVVTRGEGEAPPAPRRGPAAAPSRRGKWRWARWSSSPPSAASRTRAPRAPATRATMTARRRRCVIFFLIHVYVLDKGQVFGCQLNC